MYLNGFVACSVSDYAILLLIKLFMVVTSQETIQYECQTLHAPMCKELPYNRTILPNFLGQKSQADAGIRLSEFGPLVNSKCSQHILPFLCFYYFPVCTELHQPIPPCRKLCQQARTGCEELLIQFDYNWPAFLNCDKFFDDDLCVGENHASSGNVTSTSLDDIRSIINGNAIHGTTDAGSKLPVFLVLSTMHDIILYDMATNDIINLYSGIDNGAAIDFYYKEQWIYWASFGDSRIYRGHLNLDVLRDIRLVVDVVSSSIESIAVDWVTNHLFWLESYPSKVRVASLDGSNPTTLLSSYLINPKCMVLDPVEGYLFWIDWVGTLYSPSANIERYDLSTSRHDVIFNITQDLLPGMGRPIGLATDRPTKRLYWVDAKSESIQSINYDGTDFQVLLRSRSDNHNYLTEPRSIALFGANMFWSDTRTQSIIQAEKTGNTVRRLKFLTASPPLDIKVFHGNKQERGVAKYTIFLEKEVRTPSNASRNPTPVACFITVLTAVLISFIFNSIQLML